MFLPFIILSDKIGVSDNDSQFINISEQFNKTLGIFRLLDTCKLIQSLNMQGTPTVIPSKELIFKSFSLVFVEIINSSNFVGV